MQNAMNMFGDDINKTISRSFNNDIDRRYHEMANATRFIPLTPSRRKLKRTSQSNNRIVKDAAVRIARASQKIARAASEVNTFSQRQTRIRDTAEQQLTEACVELDATIMAANAPEIKPEIPSKFLAKATELANDFKEVIQAVGAFKEEQVASKRFSEWLKKAKEALKTCIATNGKLTTYVEDAQREWGEQEE